MYYSAWDNDLQQYFHTGRNSKSRKQCINEVLNMFNNDAEEDLFKLPEKEREEFLAECQYVKIHTHKRKI